MLLNWEEVIMSGVRSWFYRLAKIVGDTKAVKRGRLGLRITRRAAGRMMATRSMGSQFG